jgi:hypothetical protein
MVVPYVGSMSADGSANYQYVEQETYSIAGIDYQFNKTLDDADSKKLLQCFDCSGNGIDGHFDAALVNQADLSALLAAAINGGAAAVAGPADPTDATAQLVLDLHAGLVAAIAGDGLNNTVENLDVTDVVVAINSDAGAADMATNLAANGNFCKLLYTQIPAATLNLYMDASENSVTRALPLKKGDTLTFVWDVNLSNVVPNKTQVDVTAAVGGAQQVPADPVGYTSSLHYDLPVKRIAFNLQLSSGGAAFEEL